MNFDMNVNTSFKLCVLVVLLAGGVLASDESAADDNDRREVEREISTSQAASSHGLIRIKNPRGQIEIIGWDKSEIFIDGQLDDLAEGLKFEVNGRKAVIEVKMPRANVVWGDGSELEIKVPRGSRIDASGVSSDFRVTGITGGARIKTISGDLRLEQVTDRIIVGSISGELKLRDTQGEMHASSVSGDLDIESHNGSLYAESVSGEIDIQDLSGSKIVLRNVSGEIELNVESLSDAAIEIETVSGGVKLELPDETDADIELEVGMGGDITDSLSDGHVEKTMLGRKRLKSVVGAGAGSISVRTITADIQLGGD